MKKLRRAVTGVTIISLVLAVSVDGERLRLPELFGTA
jgi:hypothetical protein